MPEQQYSLREAMKYANVFEKKSGVVYYAKNGRRAIYDVIAEDVGAMIIDGVHAVLAETTQLGFSRDVPNSEAYFIQHGIDINSGWNIIPMLGGQYEH